MDVVGGGAGLSGAAPFDRWRHAFSLVTLGATLALIVAGGLVTSTDAGLSVPDWPLSYGMLMPPMVGRVFFEHLHRMVAATVGLLTLALAVWTARSEARRSVRVLAWTAFGVVVAQGLLGGLTVILLLPTAVSVAHACLAQTFFCLIVALALLTSRGWLAPVAPRPDPGLRSAGLLVAGLVYLQLILGAVMRHLDSRSWAGSSLAIPDFPLSLGHWVPPLTSGAVAVHFAHRILALGVLVSSLALWVRVRRVGEESLRSPALVLPGLVGVQIVLGATTVLSAKAVIPTTAHVVTGAIILGTSVWFCLRAFRAFEAPEAEGRAVASLAMNR